MTYLLIIYKNKSKYTKYGRLDETKFIGDAIIFNKPKT